MKKDNNSKQIILRQKAEEQLKQQQSSLNSISMECDKIKLIHELQVHQIELEMQNEELKIAREKAEESDLLKTAFIANISHEIRTPMNGILGFSQMLTKQNLSELKTKQYIEIIRNCGNQLMLIIDDLIDISKIEANQIKIESKPVSINDVLSEIFTILHPIAISSKIDLIFVHDKNANQNIILSDGTRLRQILINLINNAIKFTSNGYVKFGYTINNKMIEFFVEDTGLGIAPEVQLKIFERFMQVETEYSKINRGTGLGLGLAISKAFVELLGGKIWLKSELGKGTIFFFTIPNKQIENVINDQSLPIKEIVQTKNDITILIADDDYSNYFLLSELLSDINPKNRNLKN